MDATSKYGCCLTVLAVVVHFYSLSRTTLTYQTDDHHKGVECSAVQDANLVPLITHTCEVTLSVSTAARCCFSFVAIGTGQICFTRDTVNNTH